MVADGFPFLWGHPCPSSIGWHVKSNWMTETFGNPLEGLIFPFWCFILEILSTFQKSLRKAAFLAFGAVFFRQARAGTVRSASLHHWVGGGRPHFFSPWGGRPAPTLYLPFPAFEPGTTNFFPHPVPGSARMGFGQKQVSAKGQDFFISHPFPLHL